MCAADPTLVISVANLASLSLGRFVFLPYQRASVAKAGAPSQNGVSHVKAGDIRAEEAAGVLKTGDPAGFNIIDVAAWGSLGELAEGMRGYVSAQLMFSCPGHAAGFAALALASSDCLPCGFQ